MDALPVSRAAKKKTALSAINNGGERRQLERVNNMEPNSPLM